MQRGEVWWADVDFAIDDELWENRRRPVVLLSRDEASELRAMLIVAPANTDIRGIAIEVRVGAQEGLSHQGVLRVAVPRPGRILCDWLVTLARSDLIARAGTLSSAKLCQLEDALRLAELDASRWGG
jgi:mRNA interferase MazF